MRYGKFNDEGSFEWAPNILQLEDGRTVINPQAIDLGKAGYKPVIESSPNPDSTTFRMEDRGKYIQQIWDGSGFLSAMRGAI